MNRRTALKQAALLASSVALLPSCNFGPERVAIALNNLQLDAGMQDVLAQVVEAIIPSGEIPGAKELEVNKFVLVMVDDCVKKEDQDKFVAGLKQFESFVKSHFERSFARGDQEYREKVLTEIAAMRDSEQQPIQGLKDVQAFLSMTKRYSIQGFMSSQYVMTEKFPYKHVPGPFQACVSTDGLIVM